MNRQAITFLTLFSLILVLSIYYILLPPEGEASEVSVNNEELSQIEVLQQNLEKERADLISENNAIIASSDSDSNKIAAALANISEAKETAALEAKITKIINNTVSITTTCFLFINNYFNRFILNLNKCILKTSIINYLCNFCF